MNMRIKIDDDTYFSKDTMSGISIKQLQLEIENLNNFLKNPIELLEIPEGIDEQVYSMIISENARKEGERLRFITELEEKQSLLDDILNGSANNSKK